MKPITFEESNHVAAKDQPEYLPLPCYIDPAPEGQVIFCQSLSFWERVQILFTGKLWCCLLCFHKPITPSFFSTFKSDVLTTAKPELLKKLA